MTIDVKKRDFLIGAAIGSGSNALAAEHGGADILLAINAGRLRNMGAPSIGSMLPIFDARTLTQGFAEEELLAICKIPILLGVNVWEREFDPVATAKRVQDAGFAGAVNFPGGLHYSRPMQQLLSRAGRGIEQEVSLLRAVQGVGLTSMFYCNSQTSARLAADAGIHMICLNIGWTIGGALSHRSRSSLEEVASTARGIGRLVKKINPESLFLIEGGPVATPEDLARVIEIAPIDGYVGGSTIDRMPLENSVAGKIIGFRQAINQSRDLDEKETRLVSWSKQFGFAGRSKLQLALLRRLRTMAEADDPVVLVCEPGVETAPALKALNLSDKPGLERNIVHIDVAEQDFPARARNVLFGHRDTIGNRMPILADPSVSLIVIHAPERLSKALQRRLARAISDGMFRVAGARRSLPVEPRIILLCDAAVWGDGSSEGAPKEGIETELYNKLKGWSLKMPPLRERLGDLELIIELQSADVPSGTEKQQIFSPAAIQKLHSHSWPGNEAELRVVIGMLAGRPSSGPVEPEEVMRILYNEKAFAKTPEGRSEKDRVVGALWQNGFSRTKTAAALGISRKTLYNKITKYGLSG